MKDILIVDAGSTKTDWSFLKGDNSSPIRIQTEGLNPAHLSFEKITAIIADVKDKLKVSVEKIFFYGAGCGVPSLKKIIFDSLESYFPIAEVTVDSDILGAGIALFGEKEGIACILGTGSSTGLYSKNKILYQIPSLGYLLGDEGSGVSLGKRLLNAVFKKNISDEIINKFQEEFKLSLPELITSVYKSPQPVSFIASFSKFLKENINNEEIESLVLSEFNEFFKKNILPYGDISKKKIGMVGSVASSFSDIIKKSADKFEIEISGIKNPPILFLEKYYLEK